jgi:hypothetical protein
MRYKLMDLLRKGYTVKFSPDKDDIFQIIVSKPVGDDSLHIKKKISHFAVDHAAVDIIDLTLREQEIKILRELEMSAAESYTLVRFETSCGLYRTFHVHFKPKYTHVIEFEAYPVLDWCGPNDTKGTDYYCPDRSDNMPFEFGKVRVFFTGLMCWRGVWDSHIQFPGEEDFDGDNLPEIAELWTKHVEPWCKEWIKKERPHLTYNE